MKKVLLGVLLGAGFGVFFAQKSGKKLRDQVVKSDKPVQELLDEIFKMKKEACDFLQRCKANVGKGGSGK